MTTFYIVYEILILFLLSYLSIMIKNKSLTFIIMFYGLIIVSFFYGFREIVIYNPQGFTTDSFRYMNWFYEIKTIDDVFYGSSSWKADYFFFLIAYVVHNFTNNHNIYFFVNSILSFSILVLGYYKLIGKKYFYFMPLILLFLVCSSTVVANYGNLLRQGLALSLFILSLSFMLEKKYFIGYFLLFIAIFTHKSTIIFILIYFMVFNINIPIRYYLYIFTISVPFIFINIFNFIPINFNISILQKLSTYQESTSRMLLYKSIILTLLFLLFYRFRINNLKYTFILKIYIILLVISFFLFKIEIISGRLLYYPSILIPYFLFEYIKNTNKKDITFFVFTIFSVAYFIIIYEFSSTFQTILIKNNIF